ncbi:uncharacterized protein KY384_008841 [Bacidia gigantensis]|uniref:uncharacterized protein n=1 Tax=Bacidia gigantensis TaxID=2732470 RepID=UPI001D03B418|nr:uncharacterized protein KY384_008841 [Bacidia gigantensis]KAG8525197.1 hypothetical protein KY384_008841 [Bacidia gigantensis]
MTVLPTFDIFDDSQPARTQPMDMNRTSDAVDDSRPTSAKILDIIYDYRLTKAADADDRWIEGTPKFLSMIEHFVQMEQPVQMCMPAFPFKSANKVYKVLGTLPDAAEEEALEYMNLMCARIGDIYSPGAKLLIISDGLVYNVCHSLPDLLTISDRDTWAYGQELRAIGENKFPHISFSRLRQLVDIDLPERLDEVTYVANATNFRHALLSQHGKDELDVNKLIEQNEDTRLTYCGHSRFLFNDLRYIFPKSELRGSNQYKRDVKFIAREMIRRGYAFAAAIKHAFPDHLRLSIHQSTGEHKISVSLLPTSTSYTTPWMCAVAYNADGSLTSAPKGDLEQDPRYEAVWNDMRASHFVERTESTETEGKVEKGVLEEKSGNELREGEKDGDKGMSGGKAVGGLEKKLPAGPCPHCGKASHVEARCFDKYPHLAPKWVQKRMATTEAATTEEDKEQKVIIEVE